MKRVTSLFALLLVCSGCLTASTGTTAQRIRQSESLIQIQSGIATAAILESVPVADRASIAKTAAAVAGAVHSAAVAPDGFDLTEVRAAITKAVANAGKDKPLLAYMASSLGVLFQEQVNRAFADLSDEDKREAIKALARGISQGVIDATLIYAGAVK